MSRWLWCGAILLGLLAACAQDSSESDPTLTPFPTHTPSPTPEYINPFNAEASARAYLHAWEQYDFETMYSLISIASQEVNPFESFRAFYENAHSEMRLIDLSHALLAQAQESNQVWRFIYNVTFNTTIVGSFTDYERTIRLVLDGQEWRVAWSPTDLFPEMRQGAALRQTPILPRRASIYDRNGEIMADMNGSFAIVKVIRAQIPDFEACVHTLATALTIPAEEMRAELEGYAPEWLVDVGTLDWMEYPRWQEPLIRDCGATFDTLSTRRYLDGELAPHVIGVVGYPNEADIEAVEAAGFRRDSILGRTGVEASWDDVLRGKPGGQLAIVSPDGEVIRVLAETVTQPGQSVYLTIDSDLQRFVRQELSTLYALGWAPDSNGAAAVMLEVDTGAVLAMASYPTFNANAFLPFPVTGEQAAQEIIQEVADDPRQPQLNRAAQGRYPSGSVMKAVTAIAALDSGHYTADEVYYSVGTWTRDITRTDWLPGGHGRLNLAQAITHSCNSCFYEVGYRLDNVDHYLLPGYVNRMGLGVPTGMTDIPESSGLIGTPEFKFEVTGIPWTFSDAVDMSIGQGFVEVTPLQIARTYAAVANGGTLYRPQLVDRVALLDEISYRLTPESMETGIDAEVLAIVQGGLCEVVTSIYGTAHFAFKESQLLEIGVCGKTGTAQNPGGIPHAWFVGYAPAEDPEVVVVVIVENAGDGSDISAPIVRRILEYYYYELQQNDYVRR